MAFPVPVAPVPGVPVRGGPFGLTGPIGTAPISGQPGRYARILPGDCGPEYFSKLWEDEFRADLQEDALGMSLDHFRKFGEGHARTGGRVNLSLVDSPKDLINAGHGKYLDHRLTTHHLDGSEDPLLAIKQYWDVDRPKPKHVDLIAGGLEHIHLMPGDLKGEVKRERRYERAHGYLPPKEKKHWHLEARLESGAHLPPEGNVERVIVPHLLKGEQLGLDIHGVIIRKITDKKAVRFGWVVGDQILKVNGRIVSNNLQFQEQMEHAVAVLRTTERPIVFEVWREVQHENGGSWNQLHGHRFANPQSVIPLPCERPQGPQAAQVAALERENAELRARVYGSSVPSQNALGAPMPMSSQRGPVWQHGPGPAMGSFPPGPPIGSWHGPPAGYPVSTMSMHH